MADDAGALLVRSGLVSANALEDARARVAGLGGTLGEQLVTNGAISDDLLTDFYRSRLLVPQVNPNTLARLTPKVVAMLPADMAIELRVVPVSIDGDNNLTVAMSDPSDRHAVDEIGFFTGAYVVRAVATQMQIAWCLAHYYGHVTALGQRLLHATERESPIKAAISAAALRVPRTKGVTGKVNATRHRAVAPITGPVDVVRPRSGELDLRPLGGGAAAPAAPAAAPVAAVAERQDAGGSGSRLEASPSAARTTLTGTPSPVSARAATPHPAGPGAAAGVSANAPASTGRPTLPGAAVPASARDPAGGIARAVADAVRAVLPAPNGLVPRAAPDAPTLPPIAPEPSQPLATAAAPPEEPAAEVRPNDGTPDRPRARSVSGEIRVPVRRAPSIRPPLPEPDDDDEPLIVIEQGASDDDATGPRMMPLRRRAVKSDPPELRARAGEVDLKSGADRTIADEPRIVIDEDALQPPTAPIDTRGVFRDDAAAPLTMIDVTDDADTGAVIHDRVIDRVAERDDRESQPILLDRPRATPDPLQPADAAAPRDAGETGDPAEDADTGELDIVMLDARKKPRAERRTQVGVPPAPVAVRPLRDTAGSSLPRLIVPASADPTGEVEDPTAIDIPAAPPGDETTSDQLAAPPSPTSELDTNPHVIAEPPEPAPPRTSATQPAVIVDDDGAGDDGEGDDGDEDGDGEPRGRTTSVMSAAELDDAIPDRTAEFDLAQLARRRIDYDPVDDGWGPPGTTIPPPLLGAIPGSEDDDEAPYAIPMPSIDSSPLMIGPPSPPSTGEAAGHSLARAVEDATQRAIEVIRQLEHAQSRDEVVGVMVAHLAETHHRAGFFVTRHAASKGAAELGLFAMTPRPAVMPFATLRLDRPSTLQDVVGTRLPYRGPMHDDTSRGFLISVLGACPAEILLVPVAVRERVVGVLFGEHRQRHTFDDQLALAARAAGMALERILRAKRG